MSDATKDAARRIEKSESKLADKRKDAAKKLDQILELATEIQNIQAEAYRGIREAEQQDHQRTMERKIDLLGSALKETEEKIEDMQSKLDDLSEIEEEAESHVALAAGSAPEVLPALDLRREILARLSTLKQFEGPEGRATRLEEEVVDIDLGPRLAGDPMAQAGALMNAIVRISEQASAVLAEAGESRDELGVELDLLNR